jgi:hypothetical protein
MKVIKVSQPEKWTYLLENESANFVADVKQGICKVQLCVCDEGCDIIKTILVDVIDVIPTQNGKGEWGWLTANFLNYFGWE